MKHEPLVVIIILLIFNKNENMKNENMKNEK
jgi:hypothetical protein